MQFAASHLVQIHPENCTIFEGMIPDYPHKVFEDERVAYTFLMLALAMRTA